MEFKMYHYLYGMASSPDGTFDENKIEIYYRGLDKNVLKGLEGIFVSFEPVVKDLKTIHPEWQCVISRKEQDWFEGEYKGKFFSSSEYLSQETKKVPLEVKSLKRGPVCTSRFTRFGC